jgi:hypothetical protein
MIEKIEALRKKPRHVRNRYAFWVAVLITLVIVGVWSLTLPARISHIEGVQAEKLEEENDLSEISRTLGSVFSRAKNAFSMIGNQASSTSSSTQDVPVRQDLDFKALLASSSEQQALQNASTSASTTASSSAWAPLGATSTASTTTPRQ